MNNTTINKIGMMNDGFYNNVIDRFVDLKLSTRDFTPVISKKRIISRNKWLDLVYRVPNLVLRREITHTFRKVKNALKSVKQSWNIFVNLDMPFVLFKLSPSIPDRFLSSPRIGVLGEKEKSAFENQITNYNLEIFSSNIYGRDYVFHQVPEHRILQSKQVQHKQEMKIIIHSDSFLSRLIPFANLIESKIKKRDFAVTQSTIFKFLSTPEPKGISPKSSIEGDSISSELDRINKTHINVQNIEKRQIYLNYPEIEHVKSPPAEIIKEKIIEKEVESKPLHEIPGTPEIDVNRLADQVYSAIERKIKIERERRGIFG